MHTIVVANPKGGSGKSTLATNIAGWLAGKRQSVALADLDPQQSTNEWLARRPALFPTIARWDPQAKRGIQWLVIDTPAGVRTDSMGEVLKRADAIVVPVSPSAYDMNASQRFLGALGEYKAIKQGSLPVGLVGMRVDSRTHSASELEEFMRATELPVITHLRDTQLYVYCARDGSSVFDLPRSRAEHDWEQWRPLTRWIARHAKARA
jgi:chromosome partitioning protein